MLAIHFVFICSFRLCVDMDDIFAPYLIICCMTALLLCVCMLLVCVGHTSIPYLQPTGFDHFLHFDSHSCKCEALCVFFFSD